MCPQDSPLTPKQQSTNAEMSMKPPGSMGGGVKWASGCSCSCHLMNGGWENVEKTGDQSGSDEWQEFSAGSITSGVRWAGFEDSSLTSKSSEVYRQCFYLGDSAASDSVSPQHHSYKCSLPLNRVWTDLTLSSCTDIHSPQHIENKLKILTPAHSPVPCLHLDLPADDMAFEWSDSVGSPTVIPSFFRPGKPESPIDIDFDHGRAALGLASLSEEELKVMCGEMESKFNKLSEVLVSELQQRDLMAHHLDVKNRFISTLLRVHSLRHANSTAGAESSKRSRSRTWSVNSVRQSEEKPRKFLQSVIPYTCPEGGQWRVSTLQQLTKILAAIAEDSESVPGLVTEYLKSNIVNSSS